MTNDADFKIIALDYQGLNSTASTFSTYYTLIALPRSQRPLEVSENSLTSEILVHENPKPMPIKQLVLKFWGGQAPRIEKQVA